VTVGLALDGLVVLSMLATIVFCLRLQRRLASLRAVQAEMKQLVSGFVQATAQAEQGVSRLKAAAEGAGNALREHLESARAVADELAFLSQSGARLAQRLEAGLTERHAVGPGAALRDAAETPRRWAPRQAFPASGSGPRSEAERELIATLRRARRASTAQEPRPGAGA